MRSIPIWTALLLFAAAARGQDTVPAEPPAVAPVARPAAATDLTPSLVSGPRELFAKGIALIDSGAVAEAKAVFKALTLAYPQLPEPWVNLAVLLAAEGDEDASTESAEAALDAHPLCRAAYRLELLRELTSAGGSAAAAQPPAPRAVPSGPAAASTATVEAEVRAAVHAWAAAWSGQRVNDYLAFYGPGFRPPDGMSRQRWESGRRQRIARPRSIAVDVSNLAIDVRGPGRATATFTQRYRSESYSDVVTKTLELEKAGAAWAIISETVSR